MGFYDQIFALGLIFSIWDAIGCGANDVANSFATAVNSKTLTMIQAMMIATVMELVGALTLGSYNASTIRGGIINTAPFNNNGGAFMLAMFAAVFSSSWFNFLSNRFGWATSSTHAVIGALIGVGVASGAGVNWGYSVSSTSQSGLGAVFASFIISPVLAGVIAATVYGIVKYVILLRGGQRSFNWALRAAPIVYGAVAGFEAWLITWKSPRLPTVSDNETIAVFFGTFGVVALLTWLFITPYLYRTIWKGWAGIRWFHLPLMCLWDSALLKLVPGMDRRAPWFDDRHLTGEPIPEEDTWCWDEKEQIALARKRGLMPARKSVRQMARSGEGAGVLVAMPHAASAANLSSAGASPAHTPPATPTGLSTPSKPLLSSPHNAAPDTPGVADAATATAEGALAAVAVRDPEDPVKEKAVAEVLAFGSAGRPHDDDIVLGPDGKPLSAWKQRKAHYAADWAAATSRTEKLRLFCTFWAFAGVDRDIADYGLDDDEDVQATHDADVARRFYGKTEAVFKALQVLTSALASFSHGANDVALSVGPISALYYYWQRGGQSSPPSKTTVLDWQLAVGAISLCVGLWFYGYNMMRVLGNRLCFHSPSRGFAMEMGAAITVLIAARNGIPVSTTNCIVGATMGVGLMNGHWRGVNWKLFGFTVMSWIGTIPFCALVSGTVYALIAYSPKQNCQPSLLGAPASSATWFMLNGNNVTLRAGQSFPLWPAGCV